MWSQIHFRTSELMLSRGMRVFQYLLTHMGQYSFSQLFGIPQPVKTTLSFWLLASQLCQTGTGSQLQTANISWNPQEPFSVHQSFRSTCDPISASLSFHRLEFATQMICFISGNPSLSLLPLMRRWTGNWPPSFYVLVRIFYFTFYLSVFLQDSLLREVMVTAWANFAKWDAADENSFDGTNNRFGDPSALNLYGPSWNWTPLEEGLPQRYWNWNTHSLQSMTLDQLIRKR